MPIKLALNLPQYKNQEKKILEKILRENECADIYIALGGWVYPYKGAGFILYL